MSDSGPVTPPTCRSPRDTFSFAAGLNVVDSVAAPIELLRQLPLVLEPGGRALLASPYDWSPAVTEPPAWIGGHSPRAPGAGRSDAILRALLTPGGHVASVEGLELTAEADDVPWQVRHHERSLTTYRLHMVAARAD